jgi:prephenate dehydratase
MGDEKLKIAVLGPLGTYTHEATAFTNAYKIRLILPFSKAALKKFGNDFVYDEQLSISGK